MSFSQDVKDELLKQISHGKHCRIAELAAILSFCGQFSDRFIKVTTENLTVATKCYILLEKTFKVNAEVKIKRSHNSIYYHVYVINSSDVERIVAAITSSDILKKACCMRAYLRGAFIAAGSITDPEKSYHFEITCPDEEKAASIGEILETFEVEPRYTVRKKNNVVYLKDGAMISDILNIMSAHVALMTFENVRIVKEMRNQVNRRVNCDAANISKSTAAGRKQINDIMFIRDNMGLGNLPEHLQEIARLRLENPEVSIKELGELVRPKLGKSGVNHRLRRLCEIAESLRKQKEEEDGIQTN